MSRPIPDLMPPAVYLQSICENLSAKGANDLCAKPLEPVGIMRNLILGVSAPDDFAPDMVLGGICIRPEIGYGISANEIYQAVLPIRIAKEFQIPCSILIPDHEERQLSRSKATQIDAHCNELAQYIERIGKAADVSLRIVRTADSNVRKLVERAFWNTDIAISNMESLRLSRLGDTFKSNETHSDARTVATNAFVRYHTRFFCERVLNARSTLIAEDAAQAKVFFAACGFIKPASAVGFAAFYPLPSIDGKAPAFSAAQHTKVTLKNLASDMRRISEESPDHVFLAYLRFANFILEATDQRMSTQDFTSLWQTIYELEILKPAPGEAHS